MEIQQLSADNLSSLVELVLEMWPDCTFEEEFESYKSILTAKDEACYLIKEGEAFIAFIHVGMRNDYVEGAIEFPVAYIEAMYVKPHFQNSGVGRMLVKEAENWSREKGCRQIASDTEIKNAAAVSFHGKLGFEEVNRVVCFIKNL